MTPLSVVLYDFDGTLVDSSVAIHEAIESGVASHCTGFDRLAIRSLYPFNSLEELGNAVEAADPIRFAEDIRRRFEESTDIISLFPGVEDTLRKLDEAGVSMGLVSSQHKTLLMRALRRLELETYFSVVVSSDDVSEYKPAPEGILIALKALQCSPVEAAYVGDTAMDIGAARSAGVRAVLFRPDKAGIRARGADIEISKHEEIVNIAIGVSHVEAGT